MIFLHMTATVSSFIPNIHRSPYRLLGQDVMPIPQKQEIGILLTQTFSNTVFYNTWVSHCCLGKNKLIWCKQFCSTVRVHAQQISSFLLPPSSIVRKQLPFCFFVLSFSLNFPIYSYVPRFLFIPTLPEYFSLLNFLQKHSLVHNFYPPLQNLPTILYIGERTTIQC